jgi:hypothetical protein
VRSEAACGTAIPRRHDRIRWCASNDFFAIEMPCKSIDCWEQRNFAGKSRERVAQGYAQKEAKVVKSKARDGGNSRVHQFRKGGRGGSSTRGAFFAMQWRLGASCRGTFALALVVPPYLIVTTVWRFHRPALRVNLSKTRVPRAPAILTATRFSRAARRTMQPKTRPIQRFAAAASKCSAEASSPHRVPDANDNLESAGCSLMWFSGMD